MRIMALDVGDKRIGVALSDELGLLAQGTHVIKRSGVNKDIELILGMIKQSDVGQVVVGLPLNMNGTHGPAALKAQRFAELLAEKCGVPVRLWDERLSTVEAERALLEAGLSRTKRKGVIDKVAAALILEGYLSRLKAETKREYD